MAFFIIERTMQLSWLEVCKTCTTVIICNSLFSVRWVATVMCQDIPLFANQSLWLSVNFPGRNFVPQSCTRSTELSSLALVTSSSTSSWLTHQSRCAFYAKIFCLDWPVIRINSSITSRDILLSNISRASGITARTDTSNSQRSQVSRWSCGQIIW